MKVTIIGSGNMAKGIGTRILAGGHNVTLHARELDKANVLATELRQVVKDDTKVDVKLVGDLLINIYLNLQKQLSLNFMSAVKLLS